MNNNSQRPLRVFEAFAGIGAQAAALKRMNINYEIVGISDWFIDAIECYAAIHCKGKKVEVPKDIAEIDAYLSQFTFSADSVKPFNIKRLTEDQRRDLYRANKKANNYGSITELKGCDMPETDLLVYSFPCQDLSTGGLGKGMSKGSGTRSGLLWEIERILNELNELGRLPEYLLLENVKTIKASTHLKDLNTRQALEIANGFIQSQGGTDIRVLAEVYPYSLYDIEYKILGGSRYLLVKHTATRSKYLSLPLNKVRFLNDFSDRAALLLVTDINGEPKLHTYTIADLNRMDKTINSITYKDRD